MIAMSGRGKAKKLENDCLDILTYAAHKNGAWVTLSEISSERWIPESTLRTIFSVCKRGFFVRKKHDGGCIVYQDVFGKIARKNGFEFVIVKMSVNGGNKTWHISVVGPSYNTN